MEMLNMKEHLVKMEKTKVELENLVNIATNDKMTLEKIAELAGTIKGGDKLKSTAIIEIVKIIFSEISKEDRANSEELELVNKEIVCVKEAIAQKVKEKKEKNKSNTYENSQAKVINNIVIDEKFIEAITTKLLDEVMSILNNGK